MIVMLGAFEHQVLEQVRKAGASRALVLRADVIPDVDGHHRQLMVFVHDDVEAVVERALGIGDLHNQASGSGHQASGGQAAARRFIA